MAIRIVILSKAKDLVLIVCKNGQHSAQLASNLSRLKSCDEIGSKEREIFKLLKTESVGTVVKKTLN